MLSLDDYHAHQCLRCGHAWLSSLDRQPAACARCKSRAWSTPRPEQRRQGRPEGGTLAAWMSTIESRLAALESRQPPGRPQPARKPTPDAEGRALDYDAF